MKEDHKYKTFASKVREDIYQSIKLLSAAEDKPIQAILEEALMEYLLNRRFRKEMSDKDSVTMLRVSYEAPRHEKK